MNEILDKKLAYSLWKYAIRKKIIEKKSCVVCQSEFSECHHPDYKKPYEIMWLCKKHHGEIHSGKLQEKDFEKEIIKIDLEKYKKEWLERRIPEHKRIKPNLLEKRNDLIYRLFADDKIAMEDIAKIFRLDTGYIYQVIKFQKTRNLINK